MLIASPFFFFVRYSCALSSRNPYIYYVAFLGISCLILFINLLVFIMVTRVLFTPRMAAKSTAASNSNSAANAGSPTAPSPPLITAVQVRGAFTVMTLLGVTWIFGVLAVGEARTVFQYVFCVCNSMQGFLIFIVRVLQYPEARSAWLQLITRGTLKKHRGSGPPGAGSWFANSNPKQNSHSSMVRMTSSTDSTSTVVFNSNIWNRNSGPKECPTRLSRFSGVGSLLKNCNLQKEDKKHGSQMRKKKSAKVIVEEVDCKENHKEFYSSQDQMTALVKVPDMYSKEEQEIVNSNSFNTNEPVKYMDEEARATAAFATQKAHILFAYADGETTPIRINGIVHSPVDKPQVECFSTFQRPPPVPGTPKIPELPQSWKPKKTEQLDASTEMAQDPVQEIPLKITEETSFLTANGSGATVIS